MIDDVIQSIFGRLWFYLAFRPFHWALRCISEEFDLETADEMAFVDFQQGSTSNTSDPRRPQYYGLGSGLGDEGFVEEDEDYELLLDEALARDGLYRGMSSVISSLSIHNLI